MEDHREKIQHQKEQQIFLEKSIKDQEKAIKEQQKAIEKLISDKK